MPRGNRAVLLGVLVFLWLAGLAYLMYGYVVFSEFDGYEANIPLALALYGGGGLAVVAMLYFGIGVLLDHGERRDPGVRDDQ